jgi:hypothetical protein
MPEEPPAASSSTEGCWDWRGRTHTEGYGVLSYRDGPRRLHPTAHRMSWELFRGEIPEGLDVLHTCDRKICVQPAHLYLGTQADNTRDAVQRGQHPIGERHARARLTAADVITIRNSNETHEALAERYGIAKASISAVRRGLTWKHIDGPLKTRDSVGEHNGQAKLSAADVKAIRASQLTQQELANLYGVSRPLISLIRSGKLWKTL